MASGMYVVRKHDCLWRIAEGQLGDGRRWSEIAKLNGIHAPFYIFAGQCLKMPGSARTLRPGSKPVGGRTAKRKGARPNPPEAGRTKRHTAKSGPARKPAAAVRHPSFKFPVNIPLVKLLTPTHAVDAWFDGNVTITRKGTVSNVTFSPDGVSAGSLSNSWGGGTSLSVKKFIEDNVGGAKEVLSQVTAGPTIQFHGTDALQPVSLKCPLTLEAGSRFMRAKVEVVAPGMWRFTLAPKAVSGTFQKGWDFKGELSGTLQVIQRPPKPQPIPKFDPKTWVAPKKTPTDTLVDLVPDLHPITLGPEHANISFLLAALMYLQKIAAVGQAVVTRAAGVVVVINPKYLPGPHQEDFGRPKSL